MDVIDVQDRNIERKARVLIVDDELSLARMAAGLLRQAGYECETCPTVEAAMHALELHGADVILTDLKMPGVDGMDLLRKVQAKRPDVAVVVSAPTPSTDSTAEALRAGAFDSVTKPFNGDELNSVIARAVEMSTLQRENKRLRDQLEVAATTAEFHRREPAESRTGRDDPARGALARNQPHPGRDAAPARSWSRGCCTSGAVAPTVRLSR